MKTIVFSARLRFCATQDQRVYADAVGDFPPLPGGPQARDLHE